jgi:hypothetical protein
MLKMPIQTTPGANANHFAHLFYGGTTGVTPQNAQPGYLTELLAQNPATPINPLGFGRGENSAIRDYTIFPQQPPAWSKVNPYTISINYRLQVRNWKGRLCTPNGVVDFQGQAMAGPLFYLASTAASRRYKRQMYEFFEQHAEAMRKQFDAIGRRWGNTRDWGSQPGQNFLACLDGSVGTDYTWLTSYTPVNRELDEAAFQNLIHEMVEKSVWMTRFFGQHW